MRKLDFVLAILCVLLELIFCDWLRLLYLLGISFCDSPAKQAFFFLLNFLRFSGERRAKRARSARHVSSPVACVSRSSLASRLPLLSCKTWKNKAHSAGYFASFSNVHETLAHIQSNYFNKTKNLLVDWHSSISSSSSLLLILLILLLLLLLLLLQPFVFVKFGGGVGLLPQRHKKFSNKQQQKRNKMQWGPYSNSK